MARKQEEITIDGCTYNVKQLDTSVGVELGHRLLRSLGPSIVEFFADAPDGYFERAAAEFMATVQKRQNVAAAEHAAAPVAKSEPFSWTPIIKAFSGAIVNVNDQLRKDMESAFKGSCQYRYFEDYEDNQAMPAFLPLKQAYEEHFAGRYAAWLKWFIACARFNFVGFFSSTPG